MPIFSLVAVDVDERGLHRAAQGMRPEHRVHRRERIIEGSLHEDLAKRLRHQHLAPAGAGEDPRAPSGRGLGIVQRPEDARLGLDERQHVLLVEGVVAERQAVGPGGEKLARMFGG
jgi:hypothetical protein